MPVLMAIDPGPHIGVAVGSDGSYLTTTILGADNLWRFMRESKPDRVAVETFFTGNRVDVNMIHTIEQVGGVRAVCAVLDIECYGQMPDARTSFIEDAEKILRGHYGRWFSKSKQDGHDHEIQALAHLLLMEDRMKKGTLRDQGKWKI